MQAAMDRLESFLERRRWLVLGAWVLLLLASIPFAAKQTDHLTSGGFSVPGSGSESVDRSLKRFDSAQRDSLAVVLAQKPGATAPDVGRQVDRVGRIAGGLPHVRLAPRDAAAARRQAGSASIEVVPLEVSGNQDQLSDLAVDFRDELGTG